MNIRLYNARILTMEENRPIFEGEVWIKNEKIAYIGRTKDMDCFLHEGTIPCIIWDEEIDCKGNLLMPGFKNAHTHSGMTFLRSYADDLPLQEWLTQKVFPAEAKLKAEDVYYLTKLAILEYLTSGVTAIFDMYLHTDAIAQACLDMGMRCAMVCGLNDFTYSIEEMETLYKKWNYSHPLISYQLGVHAEYTCSKELIVRVSDLAHKFHAPVYSHNSETRGEVEACQERYGMTPTMFFDSMGLFAYGGGGFHCVHMSDYDLDIFKRRGLYVVTNPGSNVKLASGIAPIKTFLDNKIPVALGTDGPASNNCLDMFREMFLVTGLAKLREEDASCVDAMEVLKMATVNGAKTMGLKQADILARGKLADIIMIDLSQPNMQPIHNIGKNLVYSGSKQNVIMTMIHGQKLYYHGEFFVGEDKENVYRATSKIVKRVLLQ